MFDELEQGQRRIHADLGVAGRFSHGLEHEIHSAFEVATFGMPGPRGNEIQHVLPGFQRQFVGHRLQTRFFQHALGSCQRTIVSGIAHHLADHLGGRVVQLMFEAGFDEVDRTDSG